ncbi:DUF572-domain-containing protein [Punctularia strigosozonata HHB-11173 SS5]|uniref:DUF572-domain-containing protein n=1 Tax=Punctularia strigosozonata (strain HHB-11173) TaxID=741275 RepID=R7S5T4_PUNST|nr:DUF572-domain-containing protein [Punctularia strigosozonata HHB-11173 SS5]EIN05021.1 DUF572-domain-containing protein [Punctularia strigosozonata HHB-11173 SS5]
MQGFNKYYPPDYDPQKHSSLNAYRGKHALGDRARKIDQGILITRFELPFNIWCGTCNNHIGMGVRYNAEKKKIGNYYSTPIFSFRCKCHLCDGWFEIQTDPKNTRYVVVSGARQKDEEWDPEENGGYAIHDTEAAGPSDPLAALEKTTDAKNHVAKVQLPRLEALQAVSEATNADPYAHSQRMRKRLREEKKVEKAKTAVDDAIKNKYSLPSELTLIRDDEESAKAAKDEWEAAKREVAERESAKRRKLVEAGNMVPILPGTTTFARSTVASSGLGKRSSGAISGVDALKARILQNTARQSLARPKPQP